MKTLCRFALALNLLACISAPVFAQGVNTSRLAFTATSQTCTSTGNGSAQTLTVNTAGTSYVALTQSDPDGCTLTLGESAPKDGQLLVLVNISANSATINDSSGVQETSGDSAITLAQWSSAAFIYRTDRWVQATGGAAPSGSITASGYTMSTARVLGRTTASTGAIEELTTVPATLGGLGLTAICADDEVAISNGSIYQCKDIPDCNVITEKLLYDDATNVYSCQTDQTAAGAGSGDVVGPAGATDEAIARFDTTTGKLVQDSVVTVSNAGLITLPDDIRQTFNPGSNAAGLNVGSQAADPGTPSNGDLWYQSTANELRARVNGATVAVGGSGKIVQIVNTQTGAVATGTTQIPVDDTIPQNTEGDEYMTLAITPTNSANKLLVEVIFYAATNSTTDWISAALFQDSTANALAAGYAFQDATGGSIPVTLRFVMTAGTTSATTFKVRGGPRDAATMTFNGFTSGRIFGGVLLSSITITEYVP